MSDTPRTDENRLSVAQRTTGTVLPEMVYADFARTLERENTQLREEREGLIKGIINIRNLCQFQSSAICLAVGERAEALLAKLEGGK